MTTLTLLLASLCLAVIAVPALAEATTADRSLVLHYEFETDPGATVKDTSAHGNDGKIADAAYLTELDGRRGVLRFDGDKSLLTCPRSKSLEIEGDLTFEMWMRLNRPFVEFKDTWATFFGDGNYFDLYYAGFHSVVLWYTIRNPQSQWEGMLLPVGREFMSEQWSHLAVVVEYPRCRFYRDGRLVRDAYMPLPGMGYNAVSPFVIGRKTPIDLDEFRLYRRALSAAEVAAHAKGKEIAPTPTEELAIEPNWYNDTVTLRLSCKGQQCEGQSVEMNVRPGETRTIPLVESSSGSGRWVGGVAFPLNGMENRSVTAEAIIKDRGGRAVKTVTCRLALKKPAWIHNREGHSNGVPPPWKPVTAKSDLETAEVEVWGRRYVFGKGTFPEKIETGGEEVLSAPIRLHGRADDKEIAWHEGRVELKRRSDMAAELQQAQTSDALELRVNTSIEFDGYMIFDCTVKALRDVSLNELNLDIPLKANYARLCYGNRVYPQNDDVPMREFYSGAVTGDLAFRFAPTIWLGNEERGLCWQAESNQDWHHADPQKAIEILPRGETTTFRAHWVAQPTALKAGTILRYKFALEATPVKPVLRDAWDLRIMRCEPYGDEFGLLDATIEGQPALSYLADTGVRHLIGLGCDLWPYPMTVSKRYGETLKRYVRQMHRHGIKVYAYQMHERFPTGAPEFDLYGSHMSLRPMSQYLPANSPPSERRPGPVAVKHGAASTQGTIMGCPKSMAYQDAYLQSFGRRLDQYGDDGIYLDGTQACPPCENLEHGCGWRKADGSVQKTFPVFAARKMMQRIYVAAKKRNPDNVVDVHCSFDYGIPALAYADVIWTGEHWFHLRKTGGAPHIASELTLDKFCAEFTGVQAGVAAETLEHRLGSPMKICATSLLHDVPVRTGNKMPDPQPPGPPSARAAYAETPPQLWRMRDRFDARGAEKLFYWKNAEYLKVTPEQCHATMFLHPKNGVLAFVSNLGKDAQTATVQFNMEKLRLKNQKLDVFDALTDAPVAMTADGKLSLPLGSEEWVYVWLRPAANKSRTP